MPTLGIDLGGSFVRAAVVGGEGQVLAAAKMALVERSPSAVVEAIALAASEAVKGAGVVVERAGVGAAGQIHRDSGILAVGPNLGWRNVPLGTMLQERLGYPVRLVNDLSAAAWGELQAGAGRGAQDLLVCFVGSGVGGAIIANGQLVNGGGGVAGELGHVKVVPGGRQCGCGELGCLEAYAGGHHLIAQGRELLARGRSAILLELTEGEPARLTPATLERAAEMGDPDVREVYERASAFLSLSVANMVTLLNPARLILGGGVLRYCPGLRQRLLEGVQMYASQTSREGLFVADAELGDDSGLIGAGLLA
ncbi:ROK family protein [Myxococcaceae bacterium GXIMD 01537]